MPSIRSTRRSARRLAVALLWAMLMGDAAVLAQTETAPVPTGNWHIRSPYDSLTRTILLLDTIGLRVLSGYAPAAAPEDSSALSQHPGARASRFFTKQVDGAGLRTIELVAGAHPAGGFEVYVRGAEIGDGVEEPNPELPAIHAAVQSMVQDLASAPPDNAAAVTDRRQLSYEMYQLSYVEADRAIAALKALGYSTIEFEERSGETIYDRVFSPVRSESVSLPLIIKMVAASKTSLQESTADSGIYSMSREGLPDLGGVFLHRTTAAEPQNRVLIAYEAYDLEGLENLLNLLRNVIDVPARQMVMEALVIEIEGDVTRDLGVSWGATARRGRSDYGIQITEEPRVSTPPFTFTFSHVTDALAFNARLHALVETNRAKILSNPSVLVLDGRQAKIQIGNRIPVVETTVTSTTATESVLYFPVGIVLNLRPRVSADGSEISMQVETIVSAARQTLAVGGTTRAPEVETRQVQTFVRVQNDTPFIIGGLTTNDEISQRRGVPFLSSLPLVGPLFSRQLQETVKKEIIIVVTPHLVPEDPRTFSFVIPQSSPVFDAFGRQLLYNAYRVRQQDVFDLDFLFQSRAYQSLLACARRYAGQVQDRRQIDPEIRALLAGEMPGEDILVRRMLWEIVRKTDYARFVDVDRMIFFERVPGSAAGNNFELAFLARKLPTDDRAGSNALRLTFAARGEGTPDRPFGQPSATLSYEPVTSNDFFSRLAEGNVRSAAGVPEQWSILLSDAYAGTADPLEVLKGVMVLKSILTLNPNLPLTIGKFGAGRQIVFPTETELGQSWHLVDPEAAKLFFEVMAYYPAFEEEFKQRARRLSRMMGGCEWWDESAPTPAATPPSAADTYRSPRR